MEFGLMYGFSSKLNSGAMVLGLTLAATLAISSAPVAQDNFLLNPQHTPSLTSPSNFAGLYAGVSVGLMNNNFKTFYFSGPNTYRIPAGVFAGYNHQFTDWLTAGVEVQADVTYDWQSGAAGYNILALGRVGLLLRDDFAVYELAGLGLIDGASTYAVGMGAEQFFTPNFAARANVIAYGQLSPPVGVTNYGGFTMMKIDAGAVWHFNEPAATATNPDYMTANVPVTDFTGPYLGAYIGVEVNPDYNFFIPDPLRGLHMTRAAHGAIAGWNYALSDWLRAGVEVQAGANYNTSGGTGWDAQVLARVGATPFEGVLFYGTAGVGILADRAAYTAGGGAEFAAWGKNTVRLDVQMLGEIQPAAPIIRNGFSATKITIGTLWHLD